MKLIQDNNKFSVIDLIREDKYKYVPYTRNDNDGPRTYNVEGKKIPSVTTIKSAMQSPEKRKALDAWRARVGYQEAQVGDGSVGGTQEHASDWGIAVNLMEGLSASYGEREIEHQKAGSVHVTEDQEGVALAYTVGSATIAIQNKEVGNNGGTAGTNDENTEIRLSLAF